MDRRVTPPKRVTSPTWGPPPPCKQALRLRVVDKMWPSSVDTCLQGFFFLGGGRGAGCSGSFGSAMRRRFLHRWISWLADPPLFLLALFGPPFDRFAFSWLFLLLKIWVRPPDCSWTDGNLCLRYSKRSSATEPLPGNRGHSLNSSGIS